MPIYGTTQATNIITGGTTDPLSGWNSSAGVTNVSISGATNSTALTNDATAGTWQTWNLTISNITSPTTNVTAPTNIIRPTDQEVWQVWATDATNNITVTGSGTAGVQSVTFTNSGGVVLNNEPWARWCREHRPHIWRRMDRRERERLEAEERAFDERQRRWREEAEERRRQQEIANAKAEKLLLQHLTPEQRDEYQRLKRFHVHLPDGRVYRIQKGWAGNVKLVESAEDERVLESLCIHPRIRCPDQDNMLAQKLMLEHSEEEFRRIANISRYRG